MNKKPKYLNLFKLAPKMSITAKVSILHRLSGIILFIALPFMIYALDKNLHNNINNVPINDSWIFKFFVFLLLWGIFHHLFAGIRFLLLDLQCGLNKTTSKNTAYLVIIISLITTVIVGVMWC